jgi:hypothetical protein
MYTTVPFTDAQLPANPIFEIAAMMIVDNVAVGRWGGGADGVQAD